MSFCIFMCMHSTYTCHPQLGWETLRTYAPKRNKGKSKLWFFKNDGFESATWRYSMIVSCYVYSWMYRSHSKLLPGSAIIHHLQGLNGRVNFHPTTIAHSVCLHIPFVYLSASTSIRALMLRRFSVESVASLYSMEGFTLNNGKWPMGNGVREMS